MLRGINVGRIRASELRCVEGFENWDKKTHGRQASRAREWSVRNAVAWAGDAVRNGDAAAGQWGREPVEA